MSEIIICVNKYIQIIKDTTLNNKYSKWYINIITKAINRDAIVGEYYEKHHIVPQSVNNTYAKDKNNIVSLTAREHFLVHFCAIKMYQGNSRYKMLYAFNQLRAKNKFQKGRYINSRLYANLKKYKPCGLFYMYHSTKNKSKRCNEHTDVDALVAEGWSKTMPDSYKPGRVGNMVGKSHSSNTKKRMSDSANKRFEGIVTKTSLLIKARKDREIFKTTRPAEYKIFKGKQNPMYGKHHTAQTKEKVFVTRLGMSSLDVYNKFIKTFLLQGGSIYRVYMNDKKISHNTVLNIIKQHGAEIIDQLQHYKNIQKMCIKQETI